jgi:hypothetical protein
VVQAAAAALRAAAATSREAIDQVCPAQPLTG